VDNAWRWQMKFNGNYDMASGFGVGAIVEWLSSPLGQRTYVFRAADPLGGPALRQQTSVTLAPRAVRRRDGESRFRS
jgi:hypothetical protein